MKYRKKISPEVKFFIIDVSDILPPWNNKISIEATCRCTIFALDKYFRVDDILKSKMGGESTPRGHTEHGD